MFNDQKTNIFSCFQGDQKGTLGRKCLIALVTTYFKRWGQWFSCSAGGQQIVERTPIKMGVAESKIRYFDIQIFRKILGLILLAIPRGSFKDFHVTIRP